MNKDGSNIAQFPGSTAPAAPAPPGGGNGGGSRLAAVESRLTHVESRLAALETRIEYLATKADIQALHTTIEQAKNSMLRWGVGIFVTALGSVLFMAFRLAGAN